VLPNKCLLDDDHGKVYFVFSDEAGCYRKEKSNRFLTSHPYFIRVSLIMNYVDWMLLKDKYTQIRKSYNIPDDKEIKWSYLWSIRKNREKFFNDNKNVGFLNNFSENDLINYIENCLMLLDESSYCKLIYTVTINKSCPKIDCLEMYKMHLQDAMQRIEMDIQNNIFNLAILFLDSMSNNLNKALRDSYNKIYLSGDFIRAYAHIKDSISFELSHHSFGIQLADYCVGIFNGALKEYPKSIEIFKNLLWKHVRKCSDGNYLGFGIIEVPKNPNTRNYLSKRIDSIVNTGV